MDKSLVCSWLAGFTPLHHDGLCTTYCCTGSYRAFTWRDLVPRNTKRSVPFHAMDLFTPQDSRPTTDNRQMQLDPTTLVITSVNMSELTHGIILSLPRTFVNIAFCLYFTPLDLLASGFFRLSRPHECFFYVINQDCFQVNSTPDSLGLQVHAVRLLMILCHGWSVDISPWLA